jgi:hypothetical protein
MLRWIVFDQETAAGIDQRIGPQTAQLESGDAFCVALGLTIPSIVVIRSSTAGKVVLANLRKTPQKPVALDTPVCFEPSGFLGLSDTPVFLDDPPPAAKKRWWQRKRAA